MSPRSPAYVMLRTARSFPLCSYTNPSLFQSNRAELKSGNARRIASSSARFSKCVNPEFSGIPLLLLVQSFSLGE
jgi:hypothetical protein